jgi:hypothetical protein
VWLWHPSTRLSMNPDSIPPSHMLF